jgi:hypothetical protein
VGARAIEIMVFRPQARTIPAKRLDDKKRPVTGDAFVRVFVLLCDYSPTWIDRSFFSRAIDNLAHTGYELG